MYQGNNIQWKLTTSFIEVWTECWWVHPGLVWDWDGRFGLVLGVRIWGGGPWYFPYALVNTVMSGAVVVSIWLNMGRSGGVSVSCKYPPVSLQVEGRARAFWSRASPTVNTMSRDASPPPRGFSVGRSASLGGKGSFRWEVILKFYSLTLLILRKRYNPISPI